MFFYNEYEFLFHITYLKYYIGHIKKDFIIIITQLQKS